MVNIAFSGWWTGWHVFPIKSLIEYIDENEKAKIKIDKIFWFWTKNSLENNVFEQIKKNNIYFVPIVSWKLRRDFSLKSFCLNFIDILKLIYWFFLSVYKIKKNKIDIVFCKWWYVALPVIFAAKLLRKDIYVHESDTSVGLTNKIASKFSKKVFVWFPNILKKSIYVWQILSEELLPDKKNISLNLEWMDFWKTNVLVIWGSQGSEFIYRHILTIFRHNSDILSNFNFFIVLWTQNSLYKQEFDEFENVKSFEFLNQKQIWYLYNICDLSITRWWATSMAEQKIFWNKLIIIPLPYTGGNHQYWNAKYYEKEYSDVIVEQNEDFWKNIQKELEKFVWYKKLKTANVEEINYSK